jgi:hypothetical protein
MGRVARYAMGALVGAFGLGATAASAAIAPGWICIPATAGQPAVSGGTGASPSCAAGTTAALAPTFISSGVGAKPTVEFAGVNVQIVSGLGSTDGGGTVNGEGNLVVGYAENPGSLGRGGSNNLIVGADNGWKGFGSIVGGFGNDAIGDFESVFGNTSTTGAAISPNPASVTFPGSVPLGTLSAATTVVIADSGPGPVQIGQVTLAGADPEDFVVVADSCSGAVLASTGGCSVVLRFAPIQAGSRVASIAVPTDRAGSPSQVALSGFGGAPPTGPIGPAGPAGPGGATGPAGKAGNAGKVRIVTCTTVKSPGRKPKKKCTTRLVSGTVTFTTTHSSVNRARVETVTRQTVRLR